MQPQKGLPEGSQPIIGTFDAVIWGIICFGGGNQTYIRDPNTGEIFRVHKRVWDTDQFWRDPTFGDIIGTIGLAGFSLGSAYPKVGVHHAADCEWMGIVLDRHSMRPATCGTVARAL